MTLSPTDLAELAGLVGAAIVLALRDDPRALHWIRDRWPTVMRWVRDLLNKAITAPLRRNRNWRQIAKRRDIWTGDAHNSCRRGSTEAVP